MIYVIRAINSDFVKIGFTKSKKTLATRLAALKCGCPYKLIIESTMQGSKLKERCLHSFCISRHKSGEWFRLNKHEVQRMINKYKSWTPTDEGINKMSMINHQIKQKKKNVLSNQVLLHE